MMGRFLRTGFVLVRHVNNSRNFDPRRRLGDKCKSTLGQLAEPSKELFTKQQPPGRQMQRTVGGTLYRTFSEATAICPKNCQAICFKEAKNSKVSLCPGPMAEGPKGSN